MPDGVQASASVGTVPLIPARRLLGSSFGGHTSIRKGPGTDVAGSRPYQPGDHFHAIDWKGSARLSSARGTNEFIVRDRQAEEMPRVVIVCDRRPEMALFPTDLPWLHKPDALRWCLRLIAASAINQRALIGYLDQGSHDGSAAGETFWQAPRAQATGWRGDLVETLASHVNGPLDAPDDGVEQALRFLGLLRTSLTTGSFIFVLSDFLVNVPDDVWDTLVGHGWDVVPVVIQDPVWEQSFPPISRVAASFSDVAGDRVLSVRLNEQEAEQRRAAHEARLEQIEIGFAKLGLDYVLVSSGDPAEINAAFLRWADARLLHGGRLG